jgi:hypothetical protein
VTTDSRVAATSAIPFGDSEVRRRWEGSGHGGLVALWASGLCWAEMERRKTWAAYLISSFDSRTSKDFEIQTKV